MHTLHSMQMSHETRVGGLGAAVRELLTAREVQEMLHIDRSTVYRMAEDGRLPSIRVGSQWRFPAAQISALLSDGGRTETSPAAPDPAAAQSAIDVAADLLGVMMVVTDMSGRPVTDIANPCPWFREHRDDPDVMNSCLTEWRQLADLDDLQPRFQPSALGFECARSFIRSGNSLVGMVLAGGIEPPNTSHDGLFELDPAERDRVLAALPKIAASLTRTVPTDGAPEKEKP